MQITIRIAGILLCLIIETRGHANFADNVSWPTGAYGLPKPITECPNCESEVWQQGWIYQDLEDNPTYSNSTSRKSNGSHMEFAFFDYGNNILRFFCMKNSTTAHSRPWPKGEYCVYKSNNQSCPPGMTPGWVFWDDENESPQTKVGRVSPDGSYVNNTKIFYCCQNDGNYYDSIELPVEEPFYLLTTNSTELPKCQMVKWAFSYLEYLVFDTENDNNSDSQGGDHVFIENNTVYYCYYKDCRHRMTASRDSFYSHKASGSEMERHSQYCSWLITVADQYVISLEFKSLVVLSCNDTFLRIYDGANESAPLYGTYCGSNASKEVKVLSHTNSLYIVSNSGNPERDAKNIATVTFKASYSSENRTEKSTKDKSSQTFTNLEVLAFALGGCLLLSILLNVVFLCVKYNHRKRTPEAPPQKSPSPVNIPMEEVELPPEQSPLYQEPRYPDFEVFSEIEEEEYVIPPTSQTETVEVYGEPKTPSQNPGDADFHENKLGDPQSNSEGMDEDQYPEYENMENNSLPAIAMTPLNSTKDHPHE